MFGFLVLSLYSRIPHECKINGPAHNDRLTSIRFFSTINVFPGDELQDFIYQHDWYGHLHDSKPFLAVQGSHGEHALQDKDKHVSRPFSKLRRIKTFTWWVIVLKRNENIWLLTAKTSTYRMTKWRVKERAMAPNKNGLIHGGMTIRDWFSDKLKIKDIYK